MFNDSLRLDLERDEAKPARTTFVLPGRNRSGGVRVTVEMATRLRVCGYDVRIVCRRQRLPASDRVRRGLRDLSRRIRGAVHDDWLVEYEGPIEDFDDLTQIHFMPDEVVIAVGSLVVPDVTRLQAPVHQVRFNHGIHAFDHERMRAAWELPMRTLTVARTLVPRLREFDRTSPIWVVPNGIDRGDYFPQGETRDGVGAVLSTNLAKSLPDMIEILSRFTKARPEACIHTFGEGRRPHGIARDGYTQFPSLPRVRNLYGRSRIWLLASREEGLPGPVLEAMACGAVVISSDNSGSCEIIRDGENGLLFSHGNLDQALKQALRVWDDQELQLRLAKAGYETAARFSWPAAVGAMQRCLSDIVCGEEKYAICPSGILEPTE